MKSGPHPLLAQDKVRYVGDPVAVIVADTYRRPRTRPRPGRRLRGADPVVVDVREAPRRPRWSTTRSPNNLIFDWELGDKAATDAAFAKARPCHQDRPRQQPPGAQRHGAARRGRRTTTAAATATRSTSPARTRTCTGW